MIRPVLKMGDPLLLRVARPVDDIDDPALQTLVANMYEAIDRSD